MSDYIEHRVKGKAEKYGKKIVKAIFIAIFIILMILLFGYVTMRLWNWLMPDIFGLIEITYWQAIGIIVLSKIIFCGFGDHSSKSDKKYKKSCKSKGKKDFKNDFSNWKYYDKFWEEQGEKAFEDYVNRLQKEDETP